jgi:SAM-dependent methyltransferase
VSEGRGVPDPERARIGSEGGGVPDPERVRVGSEGGGVPDPERVRVGSEGGGVPDLERVREGSEARGVPDLERVRLSYDAVADAYVERVHGELAHKPLDRALLGAFGEQLLAVHGPGSSACDIGCGPGHVGAVLAQQGVSVTGIDLSPEMVARARALHPEMAFEVGTMTSLDVPGGRFSGIVAFYSIIHLLTDAEVDAALAEFHRVLAAGGLLLIAVHLAEGGNSTVHTGEMLGVSVDLDFRFFDIDGLAAAIAAAGFEVTARLVRAPYDGVEVPTTRGYLLARRMGE